MLSISFVVSLIRSKMPCSQTKAYQGRKVQDSVEQIGAAEVTRYISAVISSELLKRLEGRPHRSEYQPSRHLHMLDYTVIRIASCANDGRIDVVLYAAATMSWYIYVKRWDATLFQTSNWMGFGGSFIGDPFAVSLGTDGTDYFGIMTGRPLRASVP